MSSINPCYSDTGVHENRTSCSDLKEKTNNDLNKSYRDSSDSSDDSISDNYDSDEEDVSTEQAEDQNIQNPKLQLEHADNQKAVDQATQNPQTIQKIPKYGVKTEYQLPDENEIKKKFEISIEDKSVFKYLSLNISQQQNEIQVH